MSVGAPLGARGVSLGLWKEKAVRMKYGLLTKTLEKAGIRAWKAFLNKDIVNSETDQTADFYFAASEALGKPAGEFAGDQPAAELYR